MMSGFVTSVQDKIIAGKHVVVGKVHHSQRMNDPLVNIWVITESDAPFQQQTAWDVKLALQNRVRTYRITSSNKAAPPSAEEIGTLFTKLGNRKTKAVALSLIPAYADQFVAESRAVPVVTDLFNTENLDMNFPELLKLCLNVNLDISDERIKQVENYLIFTADIHS